MAIYDINGYPLTVDGGGEGITVKRNNAEIVNQFLGVAQSYLNQSGITYQDAKTIFDSANYISGIDCSTFVLLCLMGYDFSDTPYSTGVAVNPNAYEAQTSKYEWAINPRKYKNSYLASGANPTTIRYAAQICRWMEGRNQTVPLSDGFADVLPGDIVFWSAKKKSTGDWYNPTFYGKIYHVGIILTKEAAPNTYEYVDGNGVTQTGTWDKTKYPYKHQIIEVIGTTPPCSTAHWLEEGQEDSTNVYKHNVNTIYRICRPDLGALTALSAE